MTIFFSDRNAPGVPTGICEEVDDRLNCRCLNGYAPPFCTKATVATPNIGICDAMLYILMITLAFSMLMIVYVAAVRLVRFIRDPRDARKDTVCEGWENPIYTL